MLYFLHNLSLGTSTYVVDGTPFYISPSINFFASPNEPQYQGILGPFVPHSFLLILSLLSGTSVIVICLTLMCLPETQFRNPLQGVLCSPASQLVQRGPVPGLWHWHGCWYLLQESGFFHSSVMSQLSFQIQFCPSSAIWISDELLFFIFIYFFSINMSHEIFGTYLYSRLFIGNWYLIAHFFLIFFFAKPDNSNHTHFDCRIFISLLFITTDHSVSS